MGYISIILSVTELLDSLLYINMHYLHYFQLIILPNMQTFGLEYDEVCQYCTGHSEVCQYCTGPNEVCQYCTGHSEVCQYCNGLSEVCQYCTGPNDVCQYYTGPSE